MTGHKYVWCYCGTWNFVLFSGCLVANPPFNLTALKLTILLVSHSYLAHLLIPPLTMRSVEKAQPIIFPLPVIIWILCHILIVSQLCNIPFLKVVFCGVSCFYLYPLVSDQGILCMWYCCPAIATPSILTAFVMFYDLVIIGFGVLLIDWFSPMYKGDTDVCMIRFPLVTGGDIMSLCQSVTYE